MHSKIINVEEINRFLEQAKMASPREVERIIQKGERSEGLTPKEAAILLQCKDRDLIDLMCKAAKQVKESIYGRRLVLFAPLYLSNTCVNNCLYCGFRKENHGMDRKVLTYNEIRLETEVLIGDGHKRVLLVAGEDPYQCSPEYIEKAIQTVYSVKTGGAEIRRVNVNLPPMAVDGFKRLKSAGIGTYQLFQETYHLSTYKEVHPVGPKSDYYYRLLAIDRAEEAGIDDVGIGVLFGLYDYRFEVIALLCHAKHLEERFGVGPHTISVPRIEPAQNAPFSTSPPYPVSDHDFMKLIAVIRLAVPYTGMILSTRENQGFRNTLFHIGISQISSSSKIYPGGYTGDRGADSEKGQFTIGDDRTTIEVIRDISMMGFTPSFCTACYRVGRTGKDFMDRAKTGMIQDLCLPNSILTFKEYILDHGPEDFKAIGEGVIMEQIGSIKDRNIQEATLKKIEEIEQGKRDIYF
ncbi:MAG: [FeFe] hydrogenase H-cluster radical SAM maturase HydG [Thermodesulfobacteriota bacterium]